MKRKLVTMKTSALSVGIGAVVGLGFHCVLSFLSCYFDSNPSRHPIRYPASLLVGMLCLAGFFALLYLYAKLRKKNMSVPGILLDVVLAIVSCVPFLLLWVAADNWISGMI